MIKGWMQEADFSSVDMEFADAAEAIAFWKNVDAGPMDALTARLIEDKEERCQWGLGIGFDTDFAIHIFRDDPIQDTYAMRVEKKVPKKLLGLFSTTATRSNHVDGLKRETVANYMQRYFDKEEELLILK